MKSGFEAFVLFLVIIIGAIYYYFPTEFGKEELQPRFYFHLVADVEFDGEPILYDEYVLCEGFRWPRWPELDGRGYRMSTLTMGKRLEKGGALFLRVPEACWTPNRALNRNQVADPAQRTSIQEIFDEIQLPENMIPYFYWSDDDARPTIMEGYNSETYFKQPYARLKINKVFIGDFRETLPEGVEIDDYKVKTPDPMSPTFLLRKASEDIREKYKSIGMNWASYSLYPIFEEEWRTSPSYVEAIGHLKEDDDIILLPRSLYAEGEKQIVRDNLFNPAHRVYSSLSGKRGASRITGLGIPRLSLYPDKRTEYPGYQLNLVSKGAGTQVSRIPGLKRIDEVFSLHCDVTFCELKDRQIGVDYFHNNTREKGKNLMRTIIYEGKEIPILNENQAVFTVFYDPKTRIIWVFDISSIS